MKLTVYDDQMQKKAVIFNWISLLWNPKYGDEGKFCAEFQSSADLLGLIRPNDYMTVDFDDTVMLVTSVQFTAQKFTVSGFSAVHILTMRASDSVIKNANAEEAMRAMVSAMAPWPHLVLGESAGLPERYSAQVSDGTVLSYCKAISEETDVGFRIRREGNTLAFSCYKPTLNTSVKFSAALGNMSGEKFTESTNNFANVAIVAGQGSGDERVTVTVGDLTAEGNERSEIYIDARREQQTENETDEEYLERLKRYGLRKLAEMNRISLMEFSFDDETVQLGDLVRIVNTYTGEPMDARIVSISTKSQNNNTTRTISIGTPIPTGKRG